MSKEICKITGTFIDEITCDIGSQNWSADDWRRDFDAMAYIGIDTVIIIRGGYLQQAVFPSEVVGNNDDPDFARVFLDESARHGMRLFFGTYNSGRDQTQDSLLNEEIDLNCRFIDEVVSRYGGHPAFYGWYICHEFCRYEKGVNELFRQVATYAKEKSDGIPTLISPYYPSRVLFGFKGLAPDAFKASWQNLLSGLGGLVDIMAFQDGTAPLEELPQYLAAAKSLSEEFGIELWNNVETFDREKSYNFPPRDIRTLRKALSVAYPYVNKTITFEFSHFMSPNSCFPGAANLYKRYCETIIDKAAPKGNSGELIWPSGCEKEPASIIV